MASKRRVGTQLTEVTSGGAVRTNGANIGDVQDAVSGGTVGAVVTGAVSGTTNLGSFSAGVLQETVSGGVATISTLNMVTGQIPFGLSSGLLGQDSALNWDNVNKRLGIGTNAPLNEVSMTFNLNRGVAYVVNNPNTGTSATAFFNAQVGPYGAATASVSMGMTGTNFTSGGVTIPNLAANMAVVTTITPGPSPALYLGSHGFITMQTGATQAERLKIDVAGNISLSVLNVGGIVHAAPGSGQLSVGSINTVDITNAAVDNTKLALMATARFKGRVTAGTGAPEDLTGTQATTLLDIFTSSLKGLTPASGGGATNFLRADGTWATPSGAGVPLTDGDKGDLVVSSSGTVWTIDTGVVTNTQLANMATARFKGRVTAGSGSPEDLTGTQATTLLDIFTPTLKGLAPASGGGTTNFLRADGTWTLPPGFALTDGDKGDIVVSGSGAVWTIDTAAVTATKIADNNVTLVKIEPIGASKILGFDGPGTGNPFDISVIAPLTMVPGNGQLTFATGFTPGSIVFQGTSQIAQDNANFFWNDTNNRLGIGTNIPITDLDTRNDASGSTMVMVRNQGAGTAALAQFVATNNAGGGIGIAVGVAGSGFTATTTRPLVVAGMPYVVPYFGSSNLYVGAPGTLIFATGSPAETNRLQILGTGQINISSLSASGVVQAAASTGQLSTLTMVAGQIPFGAPTGGGLTQDSHLVWDNTNKRLGLGASIGSPSFDLSVADSINGAAIVAITNSNAGALATAQYIVQAGGTTTGSFGTTGTGFTATVSQPNLGASTPFLLATSGLPLYIGAKIDISFQTGFSPQAEVMRLLSTGETVVHGKLSGGTAAATELVLQGTTDSTHRGHVTSLDPLGVGRSAGVLGGLPMFAVAGNATLNSAASTSLDYFVVNSSTITVTGSTNITTTIDGFGYVVFQPPTISTSVIIGAGGSAPAAATVVITGAPGITGGGSFAGGVGSVGLWVQATAQIDGDLRMGSGTFVSNGDIAINGTLGSAQVSSGIVRGIGQLYVGTLPTFAFQATMDAGPSNPKVGFFSTGPVVQPNVTGSRSGGTALANLLNFLGTSAGGLGLIQNNTTV